MYTTFQATGTELAQPKKLPKNLDAMIAEIKRRENHEVYERQFQNALDSAVQDPLALYRFFALYNALNAGIASTVQVLVGHVNQSTEIFIDKNIRVDALKSRSFEFGKIIEIAATDEIGDARFGNVTHQVLAMGLMESVGNYAGLDTGEKNALFRTPSWLDALVKKKIQPLYAGQPNDLKSMVRALGAHIYSEFSADDVEFSRMCKKLFIDLEGRGFHAYLQRNPAITVQGHAFDPTSWLKTHGGYKNGTIHKAEYDHLETGFDAAKLWLEIAPIKDRQQILKGIFEGITAMHECLEEFFVNARHECDLVVATRNSLHAAATRKPAATVRPKAARHVAMA